MIRVLSLTAHETLRRRVHSQPFCGRCAAPLCLSRAVSVEVVEVEPGVEGRKIHELVCGACYDGPVETERAENPAWRYAVLDGRKLFERKSHPRGLNREEKSQ
jgi:hypothetical protein